MTYGQKKQLYKAGLYECTTPKGDTSRWSVSDWVNFIDTNGVWL